MYIDEKLLKTLETDRQIEACSDTQCEKEVRRAINHRGEKRHDQESQEDLLCKIGLC